MNLKKSIANPFLVGLNPRIPDGKHLMSNAMKSQAVKEFTFGDVEDMEVQEVGPDGTSDFPIYTPKDTMDLLFFPGLNNMIIVANTSPREPQFWHGANVGGFLTPTGDGSFTNGTNTSEHRQFRYHTPVPMDTHRGLVAVPIPQDSNEPDGDGTNRFGTQYQVVHGLSNTINWANGDTAIQKWRLVTAGLRISCINNAQNNAGWFEAQRINIPKDGNDIWGFLPRPYGRDPAWHPADTNAVVANETSYNKWYANNYYIISGKPYMDDLEIDEVNLPAYSGGGLPLPLIPKSNMFDNPTYMSGKLRDMHKQVFKLKPGSDEHEYKELPSGNIGQSDYNNNFPFNVQTINDARVQIRGPDSFVDDSFDAIHIRIHGSPGTRVLLHYVANQELVYQEGALVSRLAGNSTAIADERAIAQAYAAISPLACQAPPTPASRTTITRTVTRSGSRLRPRMVTRSMRSGRVRSASAPARPSARRRLF